MRHFKGFLILIVYSITPVGIFKAPTKPVYVLVHGALGRCMVF
ncbi:MAG: hypothetical protein U5L45_00955 [Saprospiraceae bacterium]|nr:hypothetical protein [Saprospiraceae bacterium]